MRSFLLLLVTLWSASSFAQTGVVQERVRVNDTISISGKTIIQESFQMISYSDTLFDIYLDNSESKLFIATRLKLTEVEVRYQMIPLDLHSRYSRTQKTTERGPAQVMTMSNVPSFERAEQLINMGDVNSAGSLTRGFVVGSNRSMNVTSAMNLTFDGNISDDLFIKASITDQNIPYQPEGNTLRLNEISNVYLELYGEKHSLKGGDLVFNHQASRFLRYRRNVKGLAGSLNNGRTSAGFSVAKGAFTSVQIEPQDGVMGPYRIPPPEGLSFTVVLANSERVFIDGKLLKRGWNNDYVIDYNTGEITFTTAIVITRFSRIRVEYEFSNPSGQKSSLFGHHEQKIGKSNITFNVFQEKDNKNTYNGIQLTDQDKYELSMLSPDEEFITRSSADSVGFSEDLILYKKQLVSINGEPQEVFVFSNDPDSAHFKVLFTYVGEGNGNYIRSQSNANGIIYEWVQPESGFRQGQYSAEIQIKAPARNTVMEVGAEAPIGRQVKVYGNLAGSFNTNNLYSSSSDPGLAVNAGAVYRMDKKVLGYNFDGGIDIEFVQAAFRKIERFRTVEFDRDWSYYPELEQEPQNDRIISMSANFEKDPLNKLNYTLTTRNRNQSVDGQQHKLNLDQKWGNVKLNTRAFLMRNNIPDGKSDWSRFSGDLGYDFGPIQIGYRYGMDHNLIRSVGDSIRFSDQYFDEHKVYLSHGSTSGSRFGLSLSKRFDAQPIEGDIRSRFIANTIQGSFSKRFDQGLTLSAVGNFRQIEDIWTDTRSNSVSARFDIKGSFLDRAVNFDVNYSVANGRELKREFVFLMVPTGEGTHTWRDDNENGVKELEEFYEAVNPDERNYVKVFVPTNEYVNAVTNILNTRLSLKLPDSWEEKGGIFSFLSRFSNMTSWNSNTRHDDPDLMRQVFSSGSMMDDDHLIAGNESLRSTLFYDRGNPKFGMEFSYLNSSRRTLIRNGFESQGREFVDAQIRFQPDRLYGVRLKVNSGTKRSESDVLSNRNFEVDHYQFKPTFIFQPSSRFRLSTSYNFTRRWDSFDLEQPAYSIANEGSGEIRVTNGAKTSLQCQVRVIDIRFSGQVNTALGYELLQAMQPGMNTTLSVAWVQSLINGLQMTMSYDGRKSGDSPLIHTGRMSVTALF